MKKIIINDGITESGFLTVSLRSILQALEKSVDEFYWQICGVAEYGCQFEVVGKAAPDFERLKRDKTKLDTEKLRALCKREHQLIWAELCGHQQSETIPSVVIRAIDSSWFDVSTDNEAVIDNLKIAFKYTQIVES